MVSLIYRTESETEKNKSSPKTFGKNASLPLTAENGLVRFVC